MRPRCSPDGLCDVDMELDDLSNIIVEAVTILREQSATFATFALRFIKLDILLLLLLLFDEVDEDDTRPTLLLIGVDRKAAAAAAIVFMDV